MSKLFAEAYPDTPEGLATLRLANVAREIRAHRGMPLDADTRMNLIVAMHEVERDDLCADLQSLHDEFTAYLGVA